MASIILIGPMGAGKTTVGRQLARRLKRPFFDSDREIEAACGVDIPTIFDFEGEAGFRQRETRMINCLTLKDDAVIATGGGAVLREENRLCIKSRGIVVFLDVNIDVQIERTSRNDSRPLLKNKKRTRNIVRDESPSRPHLPFRCTYTRKHKPSKSSPGGRSHQYSLTPTTKPVNKKKDRSSHESITRRPRQSQLSHLYRQRHHRRPEPL